MGHLFALTDGTTTISLVASGVMLENYAMGVPQGDEPTAADTVDIVITGATGAAVQTQAQAIYAMIEAARRYNRTRTGARVYVTAQLISDASVWRSQVVDARMEMADDALAVWANNMVRCTLYIERVPYWEGPEAALTLSNGNGTNSTGLNIYNVNDGSGSSPNKRNNYAQIAAGAITGALPAPLRVELKNAAGGVIVLSSIYLAINANSDPASFVHIIEAESRTWGGTTASDANCSGGSKLSFTSYGPSVQAYWTIDATALQKTAGRWFRALVAVRSRTAAPSVLETMQADLRDSTGVNVLYRGPEVTVNPNGTAGYPLVDLGALPLPPGSAAASYERLQLWITLRLSAGTATTQIDYIQLMPADNYRPLRIVPIGTNNGDVIVDDGIDGASYATANGFKGPFLRSFSSPLMAEPGKLQRIYLQSDSDTLPLSITDKWTIKAWYRPRRVSI